VISTHSQAYAADVRLGLALMLCSVRACRCCQSSKFRPTAVHYHLTQEHAGLEWQECEGEIVLDVAPLGGRLILFLSGAVDHAIAPAGADLVTATAWFS
jgi:hypothetical protein